MVCHTSPGPRHWCSALSALGGSCSSSFVPEGLSEIDNCSVILCPLKQGPPPSATWSLVPRHSKFGKELEAARGTGCRPVTPKEKPPGCSCGLGAESSWWHGWLLCGVSSSWWNPEPFLGGFGLQEAIPCLQGGGGREVGWYLGLISYSCMLGVEVENLSTGHSVGVE